jgi:hypothetical protein
MRSAHHRRNTRNGPQCGCGAPFWTRRHAIIATAVDRVLELLYRATGH